MVSVRAEGFSEARRRWRGWRSESDAPLVFRLHERGLPVHGRCVGTDGRGVPGLALTLGDLRLCTDRDGYFETRNAPPRALPLAIASPHWIARAQVVVPPASDVHVPVYRPARVLARIHDGAWSYLPTFEVTGGERRCRRGDFFEFRCVPGPVRIAWRGHELARLVVAEGEEREDVDLWYPEDAANPSPGSWVDVDFSELPAQPAGEAWGLWPNRGWQRLGSLGPKSVTRLALPAPGLARLRVRAHVVGIWEQPATDETRVLLRTPPLTTLRMTLTDASGHTVRDGVVAVRAKGSPDLLASGWSYRAMGGPPEGSAWRRDHFQASDLGPGTFDLVWLPPGSRTPVCVRADLVVGAEGGIRDLGTLRLPLR
jgi:hypothetical protein